MTFRPLKGNVVAEGVDTIHVSTVISIRNIRSSEYVNIDKYIASIERKVTKVFSFCVFDQQYNPKSIILNASREFGVYVSIMVSKDNLIVSCQFGGTFFILNEFRLCPILCRKLSLELNSFFRLTRVDDYMDVLGGVYDFFPVGDGEFFGHFWKYNFKYRRDIWADKNNKEKELIETGFSFRNSTFQLCVYDKLEELNKAKGKAKASMLSRYQELSLGQPVTRIEARLLKDSLDPIREYFYEPSITEENFLLSLRHLITQRRKLRVRKNGRDKDARRYEIDSNWVYRFSMRGDCYIDKNKPSNLLVLDQRPNLEKATLKFVKALASNEIKSPVDFLANFDRYLIHEVYEKERQKKSRSGVMHL